MSVGWILQWNDYPFAAGSRSSTLEAPSTQSRGKSCSLCSRSFPLAIIRRQSSLVLFLCCGLVAGLGVPNLKTQAQTVATPKYIQSSAASGTRVIRPDTWSMLSFEVANPTDVAFNVLASSYFESRASLQFGRQLWIPPHAKRRSSYPVRPPAKTGQETNLVNIRSLLIDRTDGTAGEKVIASPSGEPHHHGLLLATMERPTTGILESTDDENPRQAIAAARAARNLTVMVFDLRPNEMPPRSEVLEGLDQLVIANDQLLDDSAALSAVRRWLAGGGCVWLMLDKVSPLVVEQLVGYQVGWAPIDRLPLHEVTIQDERLVPGEQKREQTRTFEDPVEMVRGVFDKVVVEQSVNGWPVACWCDVGRGKLLMTTLEARAWYRHWNSQDVRHENVRKRSTYAATESLQLLAEQFLTVRKPEVQSAEIFRSSVAREIGQEIMSRGAVTRVLGGMCLGLLVTSVICFRLGRTAIIGWLGPVMAIVAALVMGLEGTRSRNAVGRSFAVGQWIEPSAPFAELRTSGVLSLYNPERWDEPLGSRGGGIFLPEELGQAGKTVRMVWTDTDHWGLENLALESGIHFAPYTYTTTVDEPIRVSATFGENGFTGELDVGSLGEVAEAILVAPNRSPIRVRWGADQKFEARSTDILTAGTFTGSALISDEQRRQQEVLQKLLGEDSQWQAADGLTMLAWITPLATPFVVNNPERRTGSAILAVPVDLQRPAKDTLVSVPSTLIGFRAVAAADGTMSSAYSNQQGKWVGELSTATRAKLQIELPPEVLPLTIEKLTIQIKIRAPERLLQFIGHDGATEQVLQEKNSPVGTMAFIFSKTDYLQVDEKGRLFLTLGIGKHPDEASGSISEVGWKIDDLNFGVQGVVGVIP